MYIEFTFENWKHLFLNSMCFPKIIMKVKILHLLIMTDIVLYNFFYKKIGLVSGQIIFIVFNAQWIQVETEYVWL